MLKTNRIIGAILLTAGTSIGAGMLMIPVTTCFAGFFPSIGLLFFYWLYMLLCAFLFLKVNLSMKGEVNMISMAGKTLGKWGKIISWITYLLLLYSLTAAYIAASSPMFVHVLNDFFHIPFPSWAGPLPLLVFFGIFIYLGTRPADYLNRLLMIGLILGYVLLIVFVPEHVDFSLLAHMDTKTIFLAFPVLITSYGFHIIIPTLTTYLNHDRKKLKIAIIMGSVLPFIVYLIWDFLLLGTVPLSGKNGLVQSWVSGTSVTIPLEKIVNTPLIITGANLFAFFAIVTSFIGVSLSLKDFLADGLKIKKTVAGRAISCFLTFIPPLFFVYTYPRAFRMALNYAGAFVAILLCIIPALMTWGLKDKFYSSPKGKAILIGVIIIAIIVIGFDLAEEAGYLQNLVQGYIR